MGNIDLAPTCVPRVADSTDQTALPSASRPPPTPNCAPNLVPPTGRLGQPPMDNIGLTSTCVPAVADGMAPNEAAVNQPQPPMGIDSVPQMFPVVLSPPHTAHGDLLPMNTIAPLTTHPTSTSVPSSNHHTDSPFPIASWVMYDGKPATITTVLISNTTQPNRYLVEDAKGDYHEVPHAELQMISPPPIPTNPLHHHPPTPHIRRTKTVSPT